jgi:hypothetical protein
MSWSGGMTGNPSGKTSKNSLTTGTLGSWLVFNWFNLHTVGSSFSCDYRLCIIFQFIPIRGGKLYGLLCTLMGTLCVHVKLWTLSHKVNPDAFLDKATKTIRTTKKISKNRNKIMRERSIVLIDLLPLGAYTLAQFIQLNSCLFTTL